jgi:hypothetical protein
MVDLYIACAYALVAMDSIVINTGTAYRFKHVPKMCFGQAILRAARDREQFNA